MLIIEYIYFLSLLLILTPPVILLNQVISTHVLTKVILFFLFIYIIFSYKKIRKVLTKHQTIVSFFLLFFIFQSFSLIKAINVINFIKNYQNILFTSIVFFLTVIILNKKNMNVMIFILLMSFVINIFFQFIIYFFPTEFIKYGYYFIHKEYMDIINYNIQRGRVFFNSYGEVFIPLFFYFIIKNKKIYNKLTFFYFLLAQLFISLITLFRTNLLMYIFAFFSTIIIYKKLIARHFWMIILFLLICFYFFNRINISLNKNTVFQRIFDENMFGKQSSVTGRIKNWLNSFDMGRAFPVFGVGLGNYYDYLGSTKLPFTFSQIEKKGNFLAQQDPHNIFFSTLAENGVLGIIAFSLLIFYFIKKDLIILKSNNLFIKSWIISFWTLFIFAILNPTTTINYQALFWIIRIIIEKS
jgi:O-antigen ligase